MRYFCLLTFLFLMACNGGQDKNAPIKLKEKVSSVIQGTIENPNYPNVILESNGEQYQALIQNGQFTFNLMLDEPKIYNIRYGRRSGQIFINPGDQISFSTSANQFSQVMNFSGTRAVENNYLTEKFNKDRTARSMKVKIWKMEEADFVAAVEENRAKAKEAFQSFAMSNEMDPFFKSLMESEIDFEWASDRLIYPVYHKFYAKKEVFDVSPVYYDFLRTINKDDANKMLSPNFNNFISAYVDMESNKVLEKNPDLQLEANGMAKTKFDIIQKEFKNDAIKEFLLYNTLKTHIRYEGANGTTSLLNDFNNLCKNENYKKDIKNDYAVWQGLEEGNVAPTFAYNDINGMAHNTADYKGKFIYVDIWATWCGPCKKELPYLEELQETYKDNDKILFTSVSIDKDKSAWERMVKDKNMKGLQLFAEGEWRSSIVRDYKVSGIPRFLLIDDEGKIVSANAPRPSTDRIKAMLNKFVGS